MSIFPNPGRGVRGALGPALVLLLCLMAALPVRAEVLSGRLALVDGDSGHVGDVAIRIFGIDAPELAQTCLRSDGRTFSCGKWAARAAGQLFDGHPVRCEVQDTDRYGRRVVICDAAGQDIGAVLVRNGIALAYLQYSQRYIDVEKRAALEEIGLWSSQIEAPWKYRARKAAETAAVIAPEPGQACAIKGNISGSGQIYHLPGQRDYDRTRIDPARGERWFCTETDARAAGWRRARR